MNTRKEAEDNILEFLKSHDRGLLITGTHQYEKHKLVLEAIYNYVAQPVSILFRTNSMEMLGSHFNNHTERFKTRTNYGNGFCELFFDTMKAVSWKYTKYKYDLCIIYPIDPLMKDIKLRERIFLDIYDSRDINKIFLVSWTDHPNYDYSILEDYYSKHIIYDALEDDEEYHNRVIAEIKCRIIK